MVPDVHRLIDQVDRDAHVVQPRLRHRFQVDRHGLALSTHRLIGDGEEITFDFHTTGSGLAQVLGAIYAVERLDPASRHVIAPVLHKAMRWRGVVGPALIGHLAGTNSTALSTLAGRRQDRQGLVGHRLSTELTGELELERLVGEGGAVAGDDLGEAQRTDLERVGGGDGDGRGRLGHRHGCSPPS